MKIDRTGRDTLKSYFVKNAVPTADNFSDLIAAVLNQRDDGIAKPPGEPLSVQADGDEASQKKLLNFYRNFTDPQAAWSLSLNPRANPADASSAKTGLAFSNAAGRTGLFLEQASSNVGIGTLTPGVPLDVAGNLRVVVNNNASRDPDSQLGAGGSLVLKGNAPQIDFLDTEAGHNDWAIHVNSSKLYFIRPQWNFTDLVLDGAGNVGIGTDNPRAKLEVRGGALMPAYGNSETAGILFPPDPAGGSGDRAWIRYYSRGGEAMTLAIGTNDNTDDHIALMPTGNVGINTDNPQGKLHVQTGGAGTWDRFVVTTTNCWGDNDNQYVTIGAGGAAGIMFYNPHVVWYAPEARASIRMGRSGGVATGHWWDIGVRSNNVFSIVDGHNGAFGLSIDAAGVVTMNTLQLGGKWRFSAVGDFWGNDDWLRVSNQANTGYYGGVAAGRLWCTALGQLSDLREKRDIGALRQPPQDLLKLRAVQFRWRSRPQEDAPSIGLIAQEVEAVYPEAVSVGPDGMKGINYSLLVAPLIEAVKHQQSQIDAMTARLAALEVGH